ncbi:DUF924 family protein [Colwelliaceae bacterium 6471]
MENIEKILCFWFGELRDQLSSGDKNQLWYQSTPIIDEEIADTFGELYQQALNGQLQVWQDQPRGSLALVILLDQMPRNMYRATAQAFASDNLALAIAKHGIAQGFDKQYALIERIFYYHPFEHSEQLNEQRRAVALFSALLKEYGQTNHIKLIENALHWSKAHMEIIERFGRFPHRNDILGRESTDEELAYLKDGLHFGQIKKQ